MSGAANGLPAEVWVVPFPSPGPLLQQAYQDLHLATTGSPDQIRLLGKLDDLPRPWNPATCTHPETRAELHGWLTRVVAWTNHDCTHNPAEQVPGCWNQHPHLVREIALLADQRWRAEAALNSAGMSDWHHQALPALQALVRHQTPSCSDRHRTIPSDLPGFTATGPPPGA